MKMWRAIFLGGTDMLRPRMMGLILAGMGLTILLFIALQTGLFAAIRIFIPGAFTLPFWGEIALGAALSWGSLALFPIMGFFLMGPVSAVFVGLFAENVADRVEDLHYPKNRGHALDFMDGLLESLAVMGAFLAVSVVTLIATPFLGPLAPMLFYGANGWLLGREFFQMAARRHLDDQAATALRRLYGIQITLTGIGIAFLLSIPLVNIAVPVLAAAIFTHLFHQLSGKTDPSLRYLHV